MTLATDIAVGDPGHAGLHNAERTAINAKPDDFVDLGDAPSSLASAAGQVPVVNAGETALEFQAVSAATVVAANVQTASYTFAATDIGKAVEMDVASANNLTIPPNASVPMPVGALLEGLQVGAGQTTVVAGAGVTLRLPPGATAKLSGQWATVSARQRAADEWVLAGDLEAA